MATATRRKVLGKSALRAAALAREALIRVMCGVIKAEREKAAARRRAAAGDSNTGGLDG